MDGTERRTRGREAIQQAALANNLPTDLVILSERWNTVARLGDAPVVAKASTLGDLCRHDSARWYQQELDASSRLVAAGAPAQTPYAPSIFIDPASGIPVSLWWFVPGENGAASEQQLVQLLAAVHRLGGEITPNQPWFATITSHFADVFHAFRGRDLPGAATIVRMDDHYCRLMDRLERFGLQQGFIHGDAQRKNAILRGGDVTWIDFEECSIGPLAWDLACLAKHAEYDTVRVLDRYAEVSGGYRIPTDAIELLQELRDLEALTWMIAIQEAREPLFREETARLLAAWRASAG